MYDSSSYVNPTPLAHADTSRNVLPRGGTSQRGIENKEKFYEIPNNSACAYLKCHHRGRAEDWFEMFGYAVLQGTATEFAQLKEALSENFPAVRNEKDLEKEENRITVNIDQVRIYHQRKGDENVIKVGNPDSSGSEFQANYPDKRCKPKGEQSGPEEKDSKCPGRTARIQATDRSLDARVVKSRSRSRRLDNQFVKIHDEVENSDSNRLSGSSASRRIATLEVLIGDVNDKRNY
ncbi:uncharacterized protein TNCV_2547041 [Trichonephila clavipes]|nr:uncharacterized protein TNCV_2547041 [Trichonephila clavipes]